MNENKNQISTLAASAVCKLIKWENEKVYIAMMGKTSSSRVEEIPTVD